MNSVYILDNVSSNHFQQVVMTKVATVLTSVPVWQTKAFVSAVKVLFSVWKALTVKVGIKIRRQLQIHQQKHIFTLVRITLEATLIS